MCLRRRTLTQSPIYKPQLKDQVRRIEIELTNVCNLKCPLCVRELTDLGNEKPQWRSLDVIKEQLDEFTNLQYITIAGAIAEPTSHPDLFGLLIYLKRRDIEISLYINGDTRNDAYYTKLGVVFRECKGYVYFTMCGSTQELHERYRVGSKLDRVLRRLDIVKRFSGGKTILTWIVFNYNEEDFHENYKEYKDKYNTEFFYTLPMDEHFELNSDICLPTNLHEIYLNGVDRNIFPTECIANKNDFLQVTHDGKEVPCSLYRLYGESHCFECSKQNVDLLRRNKIFNVAESETETSEKDLRLYEDDS